MRSSSYGTHEWCSHQYFLAYGLGLPQKSNKAAEKGNVVHKVMECLALVKVAEQEGRDFIEDETIGKLPLDLCYVENLLGTAYKEKRDKASHLEWKATDLSDCKKWVNLILNYQDGLFDPRKRHIIAPEKHFEITIDKPWAAYEYTLPDGKKINGQLGLKGTVDLITELEPGTIEVVDWKTGQRKDWNTGKEKSYKHLTTDPQLRMYYYAMTKLYPDVENILMTIFYARFGGPFTIAFGPRDIEATELMIKRKFETIKKTVQPKLTISDKCFFMCPYGPKGGFYKDTNLTTCQAMNKEVKLYGIDTTMKNHTHPGFNLHQYQDGGGKSAAERAESKK
jgi:ATP-dependent helicase/DNAse subunit B